MECPFNICCPFPGRYWTVTTAEYKFLSMRQHPRIALITPRVVDDCLKLTAPSMEPVNVPLHIPDPTVNVHVRLGKITSIIVAYRGVV